METLNLFLFLSVAVPLSVVLIMSKNKAKSLIFFVIVGSVVGLFCGELNGLISKLLPYSQTTYVTTFSPIVEEIFKMLPILIFAFAMKPSRQSLIEAAIAVGVGFAILENAFVFANNVGQISTIIAILRAFGAGLMHVMTMLFFGFGLSFVIKRRKLYVPGTIELIAVAIIYHSIYNYLVSCSFYVAAFLIPTLLFIPSVFFIKKISKDQPTA